MKIGAGATAHVQVTGVTADQHHPQDHPPEDHVGTDITAVEQETLTDGSDSDGLHTHPLSALDADIVTHAALGDAHHTDVHAHAHGDATGQGVNDHHGEVHDDDEHSNVVEIIKTADETVSSSTTPQNDDHLVHSIAVNEEWSYELTLIHTSTTGQATRNLFVLPSGAEGYGLLVHGPDNVDIQNDITVSKNTFPTSSKAIVKYYVYVKNGANAGSVQFQWAQGSASGSNTIYKGSSMIGRKVV